MIEGDRQDWLNRFRTYDQKFLQGVTEVWQAAISRLSGDPEEDEITAALVVKLRSDPNTRPCGCRRSRWQHLHRLRM